MQLLYFDILVSKKERKEKIFAVSLDNLPLISFLT